MNDNQEYLEPLEEDYELSFPSWFWIATLLIILAAFCLGHDVAQIYELHETAGLPYTETYKIGRSMGLYP